MKIEVADTEQKRELGLGGRDSLAPDAGMLFVFNEPGYPGFWMKDMRFPLDFIWMDELYKIVDITENVPPKSYPKIFTPREPVMYVLEVNAGAAMRLGLKIGNTL